MKAMKTAAVVSLLALTLGVSAGTSVTYEPPGRDDEFVRLVRIESRPGPEPIEEKQRVYSPHRTRWFRIDVSPGTVPYDRRVGRVHVGGPGAFGRTVAFSNFKAHDVRWVNEELLYVNVWHGRVLATEHVFDVVGAKPIYQKTAIYSTDPD